MSANDDTQESRRERAAEQRGRDIEAVNARFDRNEREIGYLKRSNDELKAQVKHLAEQVTNLTSQLKAKLEVEEAVHTQVEKNAKDLVTKKDALWTVIGVVIALGMLLVAIAAYLHGSSPS